MYDDGHQWCFGCGYYVPPTGITLGSLKTALEAPKTDEVRGIYLPDDCIPYYPFKTLEWIKSYGLTETDLRNNYVVWSESRGLLIFPYYLDKGELGGWQGRNFGSYYNQKWFGRGKLEEILVFKGPKSSCLYVVEDIISSIKLAKAGLQAMPVFGSHVSKRRLFRLRLLGIESLIIWLDKDKQRESNKFAKQARFLGYNSKCLITNKDPKSYSIEEIKELTSSQ